jgi:hypothetical protein
MPRIGSDEPTNLLWGVILLSPALRGPSNPLSYGISLSLSRLTFRRMQGAQSLFLLSVSTETGDRDTAAVGPLNNVEVLE